MPNSLIISLSYGLHELVHHGFHDLPFLLNKVKAASVFNRASKSCVGSVNHDKKSDVSLGFE